MVTRKTVQSHEDTEKDTVPFPRMRIERDLLERITKLAQRYPVKVNINEQAKACLKAGIEVEEHGGTTPMLEARMAEIAELLQKKQAEQFAELEERLLTVLRDHNIKQKKGRGGMGPK